MTLGGSLVMWAGFALSGPIWLPAVGLLVGPAGVFGMFSGFTKFTDEKKRMSFLRLYMMCMLSLARSDSVFSDQERRQIDRSLQGFDLTKAQTQELLSLPQVPPEKLVIPEGVSEEHRRLILINCYTLLYCDGVRDVENEAFDLLANKLGFDAVQVESIKQQAMQSVDSQDELLMNIGVLTDYLIPRNYLDATLDVLLSVTPKKDSIRRLKEGIIKRHDADRHGTCDITAGKWAETSLASAYFLCRTMICNDRDAAAKVDERFQKISKEMGREKSMTAFAELSATFTKELRVPLRKWFEAAAREAGTMEKD